jgi:hypothetical protein
LGYSASLWVLDMKKKADIKKKAWSMKEVNRVVPKTYPSGKPISPEKRREIYAYYLLEKRLMQLKCSDSRKKMRKVI